MKQKSLRIIFNAITCFQVKKHFINETCIEATHHIGDATVSACIQGIQVELPIVHQAAISQTKIDPRHSNYPVWRWLCTTK
jgi:hypothetical protein